MPLLKSPDAERVTNSAIVLDLGDLAAEARRLRQRAEAEAQRIVDEAKQRAEQLQAGAEARGLEQGLAEGREKGHAEGLEQGKAEALEQWRKKLATLHKQWGEAAQQWQGRFDELDRAARQAVLHFALKLAEKIVHRRLEVDPTLVANQVEAALKQVLGVSRVTVCVHPEDRPLLEEAMPELAATIGQFDRVEVVDDPTVTRGGCVLRYGQGRLDATVETQMARIVEALIGGPGPADGADQGDET